VTSRVLIAGGCVLTLGARTPNHKQADVLIEDDVIAEVGTASAPGTPNTSTRPTRS
jgi:hypothetical protein